MTEQRKRKWSVHIDGPLLFIVVIAFMFVMPLVAVTCAAARVRETCSKVYSDCVKANKSDCTEVLKECSKL
jgi:hypothetical protein